jgi:hypothetical protein
LGHQDRQGSGFHPVSLSPHGRPRPAERTDSLP